jgi:hypothetical protein
VHQTNFLLPELVLENQIILLQELAQEPQTNLLVLVRELCYQIILQREPVLERLQTNHPQEQQQEHLQTILAWVRHQIRQIQVELAQALELLQILQIPPWQEPVRQRQVLGLLQRLEQVQERQRQVLAHQMQWVLLLEQPQTIPLLLLQSQFGLPVLEQPQTLQIPPWQ